jgi:hypothetical protein
MFLQYLHNCCLSFMYSYLDSSMPFWFEQLSVYLAVEVRLYIFCSTKHYFCLLFMYSRFDSLMWFYFGQFVCFPCHFDWFGC